MFKNFAIFSLPLVLATTVSLNAIAADDVVAEYNDVKITKKQVEDKLKMFGGGNLPNGIKSFDDFPKEAQHNIARSFALSQIILKEAENNGFKETNEIKQEYEELKKTIIQKHFLKSIIEPEITDKKVKDAYKEITMQIENQEERKVKHILVKTEDEIKQVIKELDKKGKNFAEVAKKHTVDTASKEKGGDLGYMRHGQMIPEFEKVAFETKVGTMSEPFKTDFGWHILAVEDARKIKAPSFEELQPNLKQNLQEKAINNYMEGLNKKYNLKVNIQIEPSASAGQ
ncbi:MAG: peptidylprolyl isomerase [Sphingobacteriia bacterium]|nr:peptidylprolyl isomerase [Sphingobacteriia bacterium]